VVTDAAASIVLVHSVSSSEILFVKT